MWGKTVDCFLAPHPTTSTFQPWDAGSDEAISAIRELAKDASSALIDIGQAVSASVKPEELQVLLRGILIQEVYVRNACLQTLQVRGRNTSDTSSAHIILAIRPDGARLVAGTMDRLP